MGGLWRPRGAESGPEGRRDLVREGRVNTVLREDRDRWSRLYKEGGRGGTLA